MSHFDLSAQTARLKDILLSERDLLLSGRARDAAALVPDKMDAIQDLEAFLGNRELNSLPVGHRADMEEVVRLSRGTLRTLKRSGMVCAMPSKDSSQCMAVPMSDPMRRTEAKFLLRRLLVSSGEKRDRLTLST